MKKHIILFAILIIGSGLYSCKKKYKTIPAPVPTSSIRDSIEFNFNDALQYFSFIGATGGTFTTEGGMIVEIPILAFRNIDNDTILEKIDVELVELIDPRDMILMNKPTTANNEVLVTGGQFRINFTVNDNPVYIGKAKVVVKIPTNIASQKMKVFYGKEDASGFVNWSQALDTTAQQSPIPVPVDTVIIGSIVQDFYNVYLDSLSPNWINCDYFYNSPTAKTSIKVNLGGKHDNSNTFFFVYFEDIQSIMAGYFDGNNFITPGTIPVGSNVTLLLFSEIDDSYFVKTITAPVSNGYSVTTTLDPTTDTDLNKTIKAL